MLRKIVSIYRKLYSLVGLCSTFLHNTPLDDVQVLSPMRRDELGTANLNQLLQQALNPNRIGLKFAGIEFRLGDIGIVCNVNTEDKEITICFDERHVIYRKLRT